MLIAIRCLERRPSRLVVEIEAFQIGLCHRYSFKLGDGTNVLNAAGIALSVAIISRGLLGSRQKSAAVLGGLVAAIVIAQRAFPFGQRGQFYRSLIGPERKLTSPICVRV